MKARDRAGVVMCDVNCDVVGVENEHRSERREPKVGGQKNGA
jgi:hypothetical protein